VQKNLSTNTEDGHQEVEKTWKNSDTAKITGHPPQLMKRRDESWSERLPGDLQQH